MRWVSRVSMFMWMSSLSTENSTLSASMSARMAFRPSTMASTSCSSIMPCLPSIWAWAMEPAMSCLYSRASNWMEELKSFTSVSVSF